MRDLLGRDIKMENQNSGKVLITGASSGIGAAFARALVARQKNLTLVARRKERLESLASELKKNHHIDVEILVADLSDVSDIERVEKYIADNQPLDMLINNAGFVTSRRFSRTNLEEQVAMVRLHVITPVRLTHAALPKMVERGHGTIINVSSNAAFIPLRGAVTYSGTKAFLVAFSEALQSELEGTGVHVQALCPGFTHTEFHERLPGFKSSSIPSLFWTYPEEVVAASLEAVEKNKVICIPGLMNRLLVAFARNSLTSYLAKVFVAKILYRRPSN
jgi:short-subunit dehydrogenase